jgi:uncharacterized membrane protein YjgN (DUF898 family)
MKEQETKQTENSGIKPTKVSTETETLQSSFSKVGVSLEQTKEFEGGAMHTMEFRGKGSEYFKIWIVNLVLSLLTLGIYSAWATVRTKRYFYGNTFLDNSSFDYHAAPKQILIGRLIAITIFIVASLLSDFSPAFSIFLFLGLFILVPVIIQRSIRFNHTMTSFRNVRFAFYGKAGEAYGPYFWWPMVSSLTIQIFFPFLHHSANSYLVNNSRYGNLKFHAPLKRGHYFITYLKMLGPSIIYTLSVVAFVDFLINIEALDIIELLKEPDSLLSWFLLLAPMYLVLILFSKAYVKARIRKHLLSRTSLAGNANLDSTMTARGLFWVYLKNTLLIILSLGFYYPWAKVNLTKYSVENTAVYISDDVGEVISEQQKVSPFADELGDAFDIDVIGF